MITTQTLLDNSLNKGNNGANIKILFDATRYDVSQRKLTFKGEADSSDPKRKYNVTVAFFDVDMRYEDFKIGNWNLTKEDLLNKPIKVDCKCKSYVFGGILKANLHNDCALYTNAQLTHYVKKTDREEKNPENVPYLCKHLVSAVNQILEMVDNMPRLETNIIE